MNAPATSLIPRHMLWRRQYHQDRYLEHLSHEELLQRYKDILLNYVVLTPATKVGAPQTDEGRYLLKLLTHALEEFELRFGAYPAGFPDGFMVDAHLPLPDSVLARPAVEAVNRRGPVAAPYLAKYSAAKYVCSAYHLGEIKISPATSLNDPSLNPATRDDELELSIQRRGQTVTANTSTDYYVYCLSAILAPRLFVDFEKDACLLIVKPQIFLQRLVEKVAKRLPNWECFQSSVRYVDPLLSRLQDLDPFLGKHFRFAYQKEYRVMWLPPEPAKALEDNVKVYLGKLQDCCEMILLSRQH